MSHQIYIRQTHPEIKVMWKTLTEIHQQAMLGPSNELKMYVFEMEIKPILRNPG